MKPWKDPQSSRTTWKRLYNLTQISGAVEKACTTQLLVIECSVELRLACIMRLLLYSLCFIAVSWTAVQVVAKKLHNYVYIHSFIHFWHAPLQVVHSAKRRHQSPEWVILSHVHCFVQGEVMSTELTTSACLSLKLHLLRHKGKIANCYWAMEKFCDGMLPVL